MTEPKAGVSPETFDEFLNELGMLETCEELALKEIIAEVGAPFPLAPHRPNP